MAGADTGRLKTSRSSSRSRSAGDEGELPLLPRQNTLLWEPKCQVSIVCLSRETPIAAEAGVAGRSRGCREFQTHLHPIQLSPGFLGGNGPALPWMGSPEPSPVAPYDQMHPSRCDGWIPPPSSVATSRARTKDEDE